MLETPTGAAIAATAPNISELSDRLSLLTKERDREYQVAVDAQNAIDKARTPDELTAASDAAERASNRHETLYRAVERVEAEIAQAQADAAREQNARAWAEYSDVLCQLVRQAATQKVVIEETALRVAQELEDRILNALDELAEAENAHSKTFSLFARMRADVVKHSPTNPGQTYEVPEMQNAQGFRIVGGKTNDFLHEMELFNSIITERGLSLDAMELPEPNRNTGAPRFLLALRQCQRQHELLDARYTQIAPEVEAARRVDYASLATAHNAADFLPPEILAQFTSTANNAVQLENEARETHPELFQAPDSPEVRAEREQQATDRQEQDDEAEHQRRRAVDSALLDYARVAQTMQEQVSRDPNAEVPW